MGLIKFYLPYNLVNIKIKKQHIASNSANNISGILEPVNTKYTRYDTPLVHQVTQLNKLKSSAFLVLSIFTICGMYDIHSQIVHITNDIPIIIFVILQFLQFLQCVLLAGVTGFEPIPIGSEPTILPLYYTPILVVLVGIEPTIID